MSAIVTFRPVPQADRSTNVLQSNTAAALNSVTRQPIVNGNLVASVAFATPLTDVTVLHGLGRVPLGWLEGSRSAAATVFNSPTANASPKTSIILRASAPVTASFWFF